jgi:phospholipase C
MSAALDRLRHIVVVMMSGRSFDHMLGSLKAENPLIDGLAGNESNPDSTGALVRVQPLAEYQGQLDPDPPHNFADVNLQLFGQSTAGLTQPSMNGFVNSYIAQQSDVERSHCIMYYFPARKLPVLTTLARKYAVFNRWFASVPGPLIPNRAFAHYGTSFGHIGTEILYQDASQPTIFQRMIVAGRTSKFYCYDQASSAPEIANFVTDQTRLLGTYSQFLADCRGGTLPEYSFVDPNHSDHSTESGMELASDQHADHNVLLGEQFIASIYNAIRQNEELWMSTALLIVYDQHGGLYDHVPPPVCVADGFGAQPDATGTGETFMFNRLGVRVPAILVSPWIPEGSVINRVFEHASIPATLSQLFIPKSGNQSPREAGASNFLDLLSLDSPRLDTISFSAGDSQSDNLQESSGVSQVLRIQTGRSASQRRLSRTVREQIQQLRSEEEKLPFDQQTGIDVSGIVTEEDAAAYIKAVTDKRQKAAAPAKLVIAGYRPDSAEAEDLDLLTIGPDVEVLCSVLAAKDVKPPISIGLFGDWGTGKTFFMQKMQKRFDSIQTQARKAEKTAYCRYIAQLWFNAWHYIDANLWASLVSHIFDELAKYISQEAGDPMSRVRLLRELDTAKELMAEAQAEKERAQKQKEQTEVELKRLAKERAEAEAKIAGLKLPDLPKLLETDPELKQELEQALQSLGIPAALGSLTELDHALKDAYNLGGRLRTALLTIWRSEHRGRQIFLLLLVMAGFPALAYILKFWLPQQWWFSVSSEMWGEFTVVVTSLAAVAGKYLKLGSGYLAQLESKLQTVQKTLEIKKEEKSKEQLSLEKELNEIKAKELGASKQFSDAQERVRQIEEKIKEIDEGRSLSKFILERVQADDYRKYLGLIASVRKDFERLDKLLPTGAVTGMTGGPVPIERIVLYIDDLDRCPEEKVVEVLQAIHLLLAFKLFVVVVGVDSRWLLHSLHTHSDVFRDKVDDEGKHHQIDRAHWQSTPLNYLEKIFQIPFALKPMPAGGFRDLLNSLTESPADGKGAATPQVPAQGVSPSGKDASSGQSTPTAGPRAQPTAAVSAVQVSVFDPDPEPLQLKQCEREFMWRFQPFIPSPRATKRFVNVYRLLRASVSGSELSEFVRQDDTGEYQVVQLLLALQTGYPEQAMEIIGDLIDQNPNGSWGTFLKEYRRRGTSAKASPDRVDIKAPKRPTSQAAPRLPAASWQEFFQQLDRITPDFFASRSCNEFVKWGPRVARYSFQTARVLQTGLS